SFPDSISVFETAEEPFGIVSVNCQGVLNDGSSKHGNARRASVDSSWLKAYQSSPLFCRKRPCVEVSSSVPVYSKWREISPGPTGRSNATPRNPWSPRGAAVTPKEAPPALPEALVIFSA